ncbi:RHS repeat-associated core domain-containing protein, partial [Reichenbachiella sp.]|uniref:RHS repeat-associated core domain-containing protein n=1 Tax=Reichenbachiella sp. TaxID=2184521 RepID=UPI00329A5B82
WEINSNALTRNGSYAAGVLSKTITTDENDKQVQEFKNLQGQVILKKVQISELAPVNDNDWYQTYYVYDEFNNLRYVLPPMAVQRYESEGQSADNGDQLVTATSNYEDLTTSSSAKIAFTSPALIHINKGTTLEKGAVIYRVTAANATITLNGDFLSKWAFQYQYDNRQRMVMKQVPGADSVLMVYDERDRLVMTQDGNQRANDQWSFTKYDVLNRPVLTGIIVKIGSSRASVQAEVELLTGSDFYETYSGTGTLMGYDGSGYPATATANELLTVTYYDNYGFTDDSHWTLGNFSAAPEARTLVTGSKVKVPGQTDWNEMITLYDDFFRVVSTVSLDYQNNRDSLVNVYYSDVLPLVTKTTHIHVSALTNDTTTLVKDFVYDHADRLLSVTHKINDEAAVVILENEYNELGELTTKKLNREGAGQYSQEVDYQYNIRGWLTKINDPGVSNPGDYFAMQLKYDEAGQYNGNIGATSWKNPFEAATNSYAYGYDPVNRIKSAGYTTTASHGMDFDVAGITYDANGNIQTLQRTGDHDSQAAQLFDDLDYDYVGNQLTKVTDASGKDTGFKDGANATNEYVYDANGNMISDANKGIDSIAYNHLNLPTRVEMNADGSNRIEYIYDAAGVKMAQLVYGADTLTKRTDYQGAFIYEDSVLQFIQHEEGRVVPVIASGSEAISSYDYQYHLKDHLGNVRATFKTTIDTDQYLATMEGDSASTEELYFYNLDSVRVTYASANKTALGDEAARVGQDSLHLVGPAIALSVVPGDTIDMEVWAYYEGGSGYSNTVTVNTFINALATAFGGSNGAAGESGSIFDGINDALVGGAGGVGGNSDTNVPGAYLSYILFDQNYKEIQSGYHEISSSASFAHEKLFLNDITISQAGYLYIYTSMQSKGTQPVYFDDMKVTHTHSPIVSKDDYYPFGLTFGSYTRAASVGQKFKHTGKEEQEEWGVIDFGARMYDAALGRWNVSDPLALKMPSQSPYNYAFNNPVNFIDKNGEAPIPAWIVKSVVVNTIKITAKIVLARQITNAHEQLQEVKNEISSKKEEVYFIKNGVRTSKSDSNNSGGKAGGAGVSGSWGPPMTEEESAEEDERRENAFKEENPDGYEKVKALEGEIGELKGKEKKLNKKIDALRKTQDLVRSTDPDKIAEEVSEEAVTDILQLLDTVIKAIDKDVEDRKKENE